MGALACFGLLAWGCTVYVRAPLAIVQIVLALLAVGAVTRHRGLPGLRDALSGFWRATPRVLPALLPVLYLVPLLWSEVPLFTLRHAQLVLPALLLPFVGFVFDGVLTRWRGRLWFAFLVAAAVGGGATALYALGNAPALTVGLGQGQAVPTPLGHVRFASALAFAAVIGLTLALGRGHFPAAGGATTAAAAAANVGPWANRRAPRRWVAGALGLVALLAVHVIAVRTGLVLVYIGLAIAGLRLLTRRWRAVVVVPATVALAIVASAAAWALPAVQQRLAYMSYDLEQVDDPDAVHYSDASRVLSYRAAWSIVRERPLTGAPGADFRGEMQARYRAMGHPDAHLLPTNQFLFSWGLAGAAGLAGILLVFFGPLAERRWWRRPMLAETLAMLGAMSLVESPLASDVGLVLAFWMLTLAQVGTPPPAGDEAVAGVAT